MGKPVSTTDKAFRILNSGWFNKMDLAGELDISRPTLDARLHGRSRWKLLEEKWINQLYNNGVKSTENS